MQKLYQPLGLSAHWAYPKNFEQEMKKEFLNFKNKFFPT